MLPGENQMCTQHDDEMWKTTTELLCVDKQYSKLEMVANAECYSPCPGWGGGGGTHTVAVLEKGDSSHCMWHGGG